MSSAFIGLGSNLNDPVVQLKRARSLIGQIKDVREVAFSSLYSSQPMGASNQPDYVNAVIEVETTLSAFELLPALQRIEDLQGRVRIGDRWGPRTLDLDILLYNQDIIDTPELTVPHYGIGERAFVLYPLAEICPSLKIPGKGPIKKLLETCSLDGLERLS